ncbi:carboxypeptidase-like regulatory domain-containing protein [Rhodohalobacter sp. SW132]|uniref:beta-sandwich domain-containing protein n=1 Tax=Rhodohalobacter sp. SW132 TaxID=2293433 RepID=UPI000E228C83|nr:DUF2012 domain-containing protein [Rhodohalobacter sp. SW132]REL24064.1 carboxypeptidase-like regulatory domain-containing protein [Rhodohalobacter sp. SW132]
MKIQKLALVIATLVLSSVLFMAATTADQTTPQNAEYTIAGTVIDADTHEGVAGAEITINETEQSATTDEYGTFSFMDLEEGTYTLSVSADEYEDTETEVEVSEEGATVEIELVPETRM